MFLLPIKLNAFPNKMSVTASDSPMYANDPASPKNDMHQVSISISLVGKFLLVLK